MSRRVAGGLPVTQGRRGCGARAETMRKQARLKSEFLAIRRGHYLCETQRHSANRIASAPRRNVEASFSPAPCHLGVSILTVSMPTGVRSCTYPEPPLAQPAAVYTVAREISCLMKVWTRYTARVRSGLFSSSLEGRVRQDVLRRPAHGHSAWLILLVACQQRKRERAEAPLQPLR
jgi:hypothetical protein